MGDTIALFLIFFFFYYFGDLEVGLGGYFQELWKYPPPNS